MFYDKFEELCSEKGVKVSRACTDMGLSRSLAAKWKSTKTEKPSANALEKMSIYFGKSINAILGVETEKAPTPENECQIGDDDIKVALFGGDGEVTDEMWEEAKFAIELIKERNRKRREQEKE